MRRTTTSEMGAGDSLYHRGEADLVVRLVERLSRRIKDICVICMYKAMVQEMKDRVSSLLDVTYAYLVWTGHAGDYTSDYGPDNCGNSGQLPRLRGECRHCRPHLPKIF